MPADSFHTGVPTPHNERLVTTSEASVLLGVDEGALWRLLDDSGVRVHVLHEGGEQRVSISVRDLLYLRAHPQLESEGLRLVGAKDDLDPQQAARQDRLAFELELLSAEHANAKARISQLEDDHSQRLDELERARVELENERGQRLQREILKSHLARVSERLATSQERQAELEGTLGRTAADWEDGLDALAKARDEERASLCAERQRIDSELTHTRKELEGVRRALLVGQSERQMLRRELLLARDVERATERYCDRLEQRAVRPARD